jgi:hypothetical protein
MSQVPPRVLQQALEVWQPRSARPLSPEDVRRITENTCGFFNILMEWAKGANTRPTVEHPGPTCPRARRRQP